MPTGEGEYPYNLGNSFRHLRRTAPDGNLASRTRLKEKRRIFTKRPNVDLKDVRFWIMSGSNDDIVREANQFSDNHVTFSAPAFDRFKADWDKALGPEPFEPIPYETILSELLELNTGTGRPLKQQYSTKKQMLDELTIPHLVSYLTWLEDQIAAGTETPEMVFDVFSKLDKYKFKKIYGNRLRTIQGGDVIYLIQLMRWVYPATKTLYDQHPRFMLTFDMHSFVERVTLAFAGDYTIGMDATGFDRGVPATVTNFVVLDLAARSECPAAMQVHLAKVASYGPLQLPSGELLNRSGGNPSGIFLTSLFNCVFNDLMHIEVYQSIFGLDFDSHVHWIMTGDDSIDGFKAVIDHAVLVKEFNNFGLIYNADLCTDEQGELCLFPPGLGLHAPYLSKVSVVRNGIVTVVPSDPTRNLGHYHTFDPQTTQSERRASLTGVRESLLPFSAVQLLDPSYPVPSCVVDFFSFCDGFGVEGIDSLRATDIYCTPLPADY